MSLSLSPSERSSATPVRRRFHSTNTIFGGNDICDTAQDVKEPAEMTGVGMMDCKKALAASDGDMDKHRVAA